MTMELPESRNRWLACRGRVGHASRRRRRIFLVIGRGACSNDDSHCDRLRRSRPSRFREKQTNEDMLLQTRDLAYTPWSQVSLPSSPRFLPSILIAHRVLAIPLLVDFSSSVASTAVGSFETQYIIITVAVPDVGWMASSALLLLKLVLRGTLVNRTYGGDKNLYVHVFLRTIFGPIYYRPP